MWPLVLVLVTQKPVEPLPVNLRAIFAQTNHEVDVAPPGAAVQWPAWTSGRLVTRPLFHLGVRGHMYSAKDEVAAAVTLQIRYDEALFLVWRNE